MRPWATTPHYYDTKRHTRAKAKLLAMSEKNRSDKGADKVSTWKLCFKAERNSQGLECTKICFAIRQGPGTLPKESIRVIGTNDYADISKLREQSS